MSRRILPYFMVALLSMGLTTLFRPLDQLRALAQPGCQTFNETGKTVCGRFLQYWQQSGALAQQGYPISNEFKEVSDLNGQTYAVQYFERAVFEKHPENAPPYDVLLSQLGTFRFKEKYPNGEPSGGLPPAPTPGSVEQRFSGNGTGSVDRTLTLKAGIAHFSTTNDGGVLGVSLRNASGMHIAQIADFPGPGQTSIDVTIPADGTYILAIGHVGPGNWTVVVKQ